VDAPTSTAGFYGKLLNAGDFVRRGFPAEVYELWDPWLQRGILFSRSELGEEWLDAYLSAPIWRFALGPGLAGSELWVGAMMPSVDRVGRYFPMTVVARSPFSSGLFRAASSAQPWLNAVEPALLETLEGDGISADVLEERIAGAAAAEFAATPRAGASSSELVVRDGSMMLTTGENLDFDAISHNLADALATELLGEPLSLWWSSGSNLVAPSARLHRGLPVDTGFSRLLSDGPTSTAEPQANVQ
jgi:type VI secretion system protein ImpM